AGDTPLEKKQLLSEAEYREKKEEYGDRFTAEMGAEAIQKLLADVDLEKEATELKAVLKEATGQKRTRAVR
ncbi:hypothetical protein L0P02_14020, partial [Bifidobacterium longum]|nr:hypothetical protein [Bifidobacterium longum]